MIQLLHYLKVAGIKPCLWSKVRQLHRFYRNQAISNINCSEKVVKNEKNYFTLFQDHLIRNSSDDVHIPVGRLPLDRCYVEYIHMNVWKKQILDFKIHLTAKLNLFHVQALQ